jgi:hypothetical protein
MLINPSKILKIGPQGDIPQDIQAWSGEGRRRSGAILRNLAGTNQQLCDRKCRKVRFIRGPTGREVLGTACA